MIEKAMDDITRATRKVLIDYVSRMYVTSFAKAITYLSLESEDAIDLLDNMDYDTRRQVEALLKAIKNPMLRSFWKLSISSLSPAWIFPMTTKSSKITSSFQERPLQKMQFIISRTKLQSSRKRLKTAFFHSKISSISMTGPSRKSYEKLMCKNSKKLSEELLLKSRTKSSATCPSVRLRCLKKTWNGWD